MSNGTDLPTTAEELLAAATRSFRARHTLALFLETTDEAVTRDPAGAAARALRRLPASGPLRRSKDRRLVAALRSLIDDLPPEDPLRRQLRWQLEEVEWRARLGRS